MQYGLATAAYNEEAIIEQTIQSVVSQTVLPQKWVIVSDGSTDRTDEIVRDYTGKYKFIELLRITEEHVRNFSAQVNAINVGFARLRGLRCSFIGNLDADITLEPNYFDALLLEFAKDEMLGMAGGSIYESVKGTFVSRRENSISSVAHGVQLFRAECLELLGGGYKHFSWGGTDTHACVFLRMHGWRAESISKLKALHHRPTGQGFGALRYRYRGGLMDHYFGTHPLFELFRVARRVPSRPYVMGALARLSGFVWGYCTRAEREVPPEYIRFARQEQMKRLRNLFGRGASVAGRAAVLDP
jgi:glycosyltransferase involved in cell wall biosynthesis